jgi:hypothetical protein
VSSIKTKTGGKMKSFSKTLTVLVLALLLTTGLFSKVKVGESVVDVIETSHPYKGGEGLIFEREFYWPEAGYISIHFTDFSLAPGDYVIVANEDGSVFYKYGSKGKMVNGNSKGLKDFWASHIPGDKAVVKLYSVNGKGGNGFTIDQWVHGYERGRIAAIMTELEARTEDTEAICTNDDKEWAKCYSGTIYDKSKTVARLLINGSSACTGFLVGHEGHLMTNNHCIGSQTDANNTDYEFMAEGATCTTDCRSWFACPGTVAATSGTLVKTDSALDYSLVKLPVNPSINYGWLQFRDHLPSVGERIYIPQHPRAYGKQISVYSDVDGGYSQVNSLTQAPCSGGAGDIGYYADTEGGSSGSPVIGYADHLVVALHHCAYCPNRGVRITQIIRDLATLLPDTAVDDEIPTMTSNTTPSGIASSSSNYSSSYPPWKAFDGNDESAAWSRWISGYNMPEWLAYEFTSKKYITGYYILPEYSSLKDRSPKNWTLQGWNGSTWVTVDTRNNIRIDIEWSAAGLYFDVQNPGNYNKYRLYVTATNGSPVISIRMFKLFSPIDAVPIMTSNTAPYGIAASSSNYSSSYPPWNAFDGDDESAAWSRWISGYDMPEWISYQFDEAKTITRYYMLPEYTASLKDRSPKDWTLQGWNGSSWVTVDTRTNIRIDIEWSSDGLYFDVQNPGSYQKYRLYVTATNGSPVISIRRLKLFF